MKVKILHYKDGSKAISTGLHVLINNQEPIAEEVVQVNEETKNEMLKNPDNV